MLNRISLMVLICAAAAQLNAANSTWSGTTGDLADPLNWNNGIPGTAEVAFFDGTSSVSPSSGDLAIKYLEFDTPAPSYEFTGSGTITITGNIDTWTATTTQTFSNAAIILSGSASLYASSNNTTGPSGSAPLVLNVGNLTMGTGSVNAVWAPLTINGGTFTKVSGTFNATNAPIAIGSASFSLTSTSASSIFNANGGTITITPSLNLVAANRSATFQGVQDSFLNGGVSGAGRVIKAGTGTLHLGASPGWTGFLQLGSGINNDTGNIEITTFDALGDAGSGAGGYTDLGFSKSGALSINNTGAPMSTGEYVFVRGRVAGDTPQIINVAGNNTFTGTVQVDSPAGSGNNVNFQSDGGLLTFSSSSTFQQKFASPMTLNLIGVGNGKLDAALEETTSTWNLTKNGPGNWAVGGAQNYTGTTAINGGALLINGTNSGGGAYRVAAGGSLGGIGSIGPSAITVDIGGQIAPGNTIDGPAVGAFAVGSATISGSLAIDYNGSLGTVDQLTVAGALNLSSASISFTNLGAAPLGGGSHVIATYDSLTGTFADISGLPAGYALDYGLHSLSLVTSIQGDFDGDGDVDGADFIVWQTHYPTASGGALTTGDANGDGKVDGADFAVWQNGFPTSPSSVSAVPEPATWVLALVCSLAIGSQGWVRRAR